MRSETRSTCPYCGVGCGVLIETEASADSPRIIGVRGDPEHPANKGQLCSKGSTLHLTADPVRIQQARLLEPAIRDPQGQWQASNWEYTLDHLADRFASCIQQHGPDSVAFYISGQLLTEDYYVFNKLAKGLVGTNNVDTNSRLCMSSAVAGYKKTLGADAPPCSYEDIDQTHCLLIAGSNTAWAHPILFRRIEAARAANPQLRIIVIDPRRTDTAAFADLFLPILPGTDVALFQAMLNHLLWEGRLADNYIAAHTEGFEALKAAIRDCTPRWAAGVCGVREHDIVKAADWFAASPATLSLYCQGLNQSASGTDKNMALIHLHLATAQIGRPGAGPFSLTGQPNAMGGREVGGLANLLPAHRDLANAADRDEIARFWSVPPLSPVAGATAVELFEALEAGTIRMVWIACTNPSQSMPNLAQVQRALQKADLVVLQDAYRHTETCDYAHVLLPASTWGEKSGTVTNSERRITRVHAALPPAGLARNDWEIAADFGRRLALRLPDRGARINFDYPSVESVWNEHRETTRGRDLDITGLSYAILDADGPQQWPFVTGAASGRVRLYEDGRFATGNGRARFVPITYRPVAEPIDARFPIRLTTGRLRDQWHGMSRTGTLGRSFDHAPEPVIELHPDDIHARGFRADDLVSVSSRRGSLVLPIAASNAVRPGTAFIAMHWGAAFTGGHGVNGLTSPVIDPFSKQPELKHCAVRVEPVVLPHRAWIAGRLGRSRALQIREAVKRRVRDVVSHSVVLFGRDTEGVSVRLASAEPFTDALIDELKQLFDVHPATLVSYRDRRERRAIGIEEGRLNFVMLVGTQHSRHWLREALEQAMDVSALGQLLLMPSSTAPAAVVPRGRMVCNCLGVSERAILESANATPIGQARMLHVQRHLGCGTQCGSCLPEVRQLLESNLASVT